MKSSQQKAHGRVLWNALKWRLHAGKQILHLHPLLVRQRVLSRAGRAFGALLLAATALSLTLSGRGAQEISAPALAPQNTSLNGPGNVFLTANLYGSGGNGTVFVAVADFNGDGKLDYVTANDGNNTTTIGVALGNGDGTFKSPSTIAIACGAVWVAIGDFNGDGKPDLAVASRDCGPGTNGVSIFLGNGDGTFTAKGTLTSPLSNPASVAAGDFNGDGKLDLAVVDRGASTDSVFFYFGNGDGTFQAPVSVSLGVSAAANQIAVADFNKDGHLDVAVSEINGSNIVVILGAAGGTFQAPRTIALPAQGWGLAVGDFNGDGVPDIVATTPAIGGVTVFLGKGDGSFTPVNNPISGTLPTANAFVPGGGPQSVAVGDFNKDGKLDIAAGLSGVNSAAVVAVLEGNGDGTFAPERLFGVADTPQSIAVGDFNGDGNLDWIASTGQINSANMGSVTVALGRGDGTFLAARDYVAGQSPGWAGVADFNKDGKLDVVVTNAGSQNSSLFLGSGDGTLQPAMTIATVPGLTPNFVVTGDFNNDGNPDFVEYSSQCPSNTNSTVWTFLGKGDGTFQAPTNSTLGLCHSLNNMVAGDFNGDGKLDLAMLLDGQSGAPVVAIMLGNGDGTFQAPKLTSAPGSRATFMAVGDLNKDGKLDAVVVQYGSNAVQVFLGNGDGTFQAPTSLATGRLPGFAVLGDFNQDGKLDLIVDNQQDQNADLFLGIGDGTFLAPSIINLATNGQAPSIMVAGDFNLDGHLDFVLTHNDNAGVGITLMPGNGDGTFQTSQDYLISRFSYVVASADFNGDGAPDVLLVDNAEEFVSILLNQTVAALSVSPHSLSYGNQVVGTTSSTQPITVKNNGTTATTISIAVSGDFTQSNTCPVSPATLAGGASCTINAAFKPSTTGVRNGTITVSSPLPGGPLTVTLTGTGVPGTPAVTLSASSLSFNNQVVNTTSSPQTVTLTNSGGATLHLAASGAVVISGTNPSDFMVASGTTCIDGATVAPGSSCVINVTFDPMATGARSATVTITDDATPTTQTVSLSGTGTAPTVTLSPSPVNFGNQLTGTTSSAISITLTNTGTAALHLAASNAVTIGGTNAADFAIAAGTTCINGATVNASGGTCVINITFTPGANGARTGSVSVSDDATPSPQTDTLSGTGVFPAVTLSPASASFGNQRVGTTSAAMTVTLTNSGTAPLHLAASNAVALSGSNLSDFMIVAASTTCTNGATVAPGATCVINITFDPAATGSRTATLTISDDANPTTQTVTLTGTGTAPAVTLAPTSLTFAAQLITTSSAGQMITLTNSGTATLNITGIAIAGANSGDFSETNTCGATLAASANCTISVTFKPTASGSRGASVTFTNDASGSPQSVSLAGTGTDFCVGALVGCVSASATVTAGQTATYNLQVTPISGFNGTVTLSCSNAPSEATCTVSPTSVTPSGGSPAAFTASVTTTAPSMMAPRMELPKSWPRFDLRLGVPVFLALACLALLASLTGAGSRPKRAFAPALALVLLSLAVVAGCGGGGGGPHNPGTPKGMSTLTVTGTSGGVNRTQSLTLTVN